MYSLSLRTRRIVAAGLLGIFAFSITGCGIFDKKRDEGAVIGAAAGAVVGGVIGNQAGNTAVGAILGAVVGGAVGAYIGNYMDKQAEEIRRDIAGAKVERIGEGIKITFESGLLFEVNKSDLNDRSRQELGELAVILNKYPDTKILIEGHTDSTGTREFNMQLSRNRAQAVANQLAQNQVMETRFTIMGYGPDQPVADNTTAAGRQANRRVDIAIYANDKLKSEAEKQIEKN